MGRAVLPCTLWVAFFSFLDYVSILKKQAPVVLPEGRQKTLLPLIPFSKSRVEECQLLNWQFSLSRSCNKISSPVWMLEGRLGTQPL